MRTAIIGASLLLVVSVLIGCRKSGSSKRTHEAVVKDYVSITQAVADIMNGVHDAASAQRAEEAIQRETSHMQTLKDELVALGKASSSAKERAKKHSQEVRDASKRFGPARVHAGAMCLSRQLPQEIATRLHTALDQYEKANNDYTMERARVFDEAIRLPLGTR